MSAFTMPVNWYMTAPVHTIHQACTLNELHHRFIKYRISSLPVVDDEDRLMGVVSRTDLIRHTFSRRETDPSAPLLTITGQTVFDIMSPSPITVRSQDTVAEAAQRMVTEEIHRVYVAEAGHLVGVLSTRDILSAVVDLRITEPIGRYMSRPLFVVATDEPIGHATAFLETIHVSGVVVLGEAGPLGVYTQANALECRSLPRSTPVNHAMDTEIWTVFEETPLHRVIEEAVKRQVWRIVVVTRPPQQEGESTRPAEARGLVTPLAILEAIR